MSLYIHLENQKLLWSLIERKFVNIDRKTLNTIFKDAVYFIYEKNKHIPHITIADLERLNKETIMAVYGNLQNTSEVFANSENANSYIPYKTPPPNIDPFSDHVSDEPISNMEELIQQYKRQRELDDPKPAIPEQIV